MKVICPISGLPIWKTPYLIGMELSEVHPLFRAKRKLILKPEMIHKFSKAEAFDEKKLIFLAVLNATELVEFRCPAEPNLQVIESNFYKLMHTAGWLNVAEYTYKHVAGFPQFVVDQNTKDLSSLSAWREELENIKEAIIRKDVDRDRSAAFANREAEIKRELGEAALLGRSFTPTLARWALDFAGLQRTDDRYPLYVKMLCTPLKDSYVWEMEKLREIESFLEEELPIDHPQVISVMYQVRNLIKENKVSFTDFAVFSDDEDEDFMIIEEGADGVVRTRKSAHLIDVPIEEPRIENFLTRVQFLIAKAKWELAHRVKGRQIGEDDV